MSPSRFLDRADTSALSKRRHVAALQDASRRNSCAFVKFVSKILRCLRGLRAPFWKRERIGQISGAGRTAACGGGRLVVVGFRQGLARTFARRHQLFQRRFQFPFPHRHLPAAQRDTDIAVVAVPKINDEIHQTHERTVAASRQSAANSKIRRVRLSTENLYAVFRD